MHHCLTIPELVAEICGHCSDVDVPVLSDIWYRTLISVALTCRLFLEPALNAAWWSASPIKVLRRLPEDLWETSPSSVEPAFRLIRPARREDFSDRFEYYSKRVRFISIDETKIYSIRKEVYTLLRFCPDTLPLFPKLRYFRYKQKDSHYKTPDMLSAYLCSSITSLHLEFSDTSTLTLETQTILCNLDTWCPNLSTLDISYPPGFRCRNGPEAISKAVSSSIGRWSRLGMVHVPGLTEPAMKLIASLPGLTSLTLTNNKGMAIEHNAFAEIPFPFPALVDLQVSGSNIDYNMVLLKVLGKSPLDLVELELAPVENLTGWSNLFLAFSEWNSGADLSTLNIIELNKFGLLPDREDVDVGVVVGIEQIRLLLQLGNLESFTFNPRGRLDLDDSALTEIGKAWPELYVLDLGLPSLLPPKSTLTGLVSIAEHCSHIEHISVPFDSSGIDLDTSSGPAGGFSSDSVMFLEVHACPITSVDAVTSFISNVFPKADICLNGFPTFDDPFLQKWAEVEKRLNLLVAVRPQEGRSIPLDDAI